MASPLDAVSVFHNAFRADMARIDAVALEAAQGAPGLDAALERFELMNEILDWHAEGEEAAVFTALEDVAPRLAWTYDRDHRALDAGFAEFRRCMSLRDPVQTSRATAAFAFHLDVHLGKEDAQVYPLLEEALSPRRRAACWRPCPAACRATASPTWSRGCSRWSTSTTGRRWSASTSGRSRPRGSSGWPA